MNSIHQSTEKESCKLMWFQLNTHIGALEETVEVKNHAHNEAGE